MKKGKILFLFLLSVLFLLIGTKSSPLYTINDWYDANCFFTMGKAMFNGMIPYLDLFEQKGPFLYFIYGIASFISKTSFIGVFIIEIISYTVFLYYCDKIIKLFIDEKYSYILLPILSLLILSSRSFTHGGSCEELAFPMIIFTIYHFLKFLKTDYISNKEIFEIGITAGLIIWMKYTIIGFHIGFAFILLAKRIKAHNYKELAKNICFFFLGILITTIPWLIYFGIRKDGLKSLIDVYFLFNMNSYAEKSTMISKLLNCFKTIVDVLLKYYQYIILIIIPIFISIKNKLLYQKTINNIYLLIPTIFMLIALFIGGISFRYYSLPIQPLMILGLITIIKLVEKTKINTIIINNTKIVSVLLIATCLILAYYHSPNTRYLKYTKNDYAQFRFSSQIDKNKTLLNYGFLDGGFYLATNSYPTVYYFQKNNVNYNQFPNNIDNQREYVNKKTTDYVITTNNIDEISLTILENNYTLINQFEQIYESKKITYYLYKVK